MPWTLVVDIILDFVYQFCTEWPFQHILLQFTMQVHPFSHITNTSIFQRTWYPTKHFSCCVLFCFLFCNCPYSSIWYAYLNLSEFRHWRWVSHLTHWGRVTHICVDKINIIGSDNGLSPGRRQAIIWTNAAILLIRLLGTNFIEI